MSRKAFCNLRYAHVCALLDTLDRVGMNNLAYVKRQYDQNAQGFDEVVSFLKMLNILSIDGSSIRLNAGLSRADDNFRRIEIMQRILDKSNRYRNEIFRFITQFSFDQGIIAYMSPDQMRSIESDVRNFLIDIGIVKHIPTQSIDKYVLLPEYTVLFVSAKNNANYTSPALLENKINAQNEIGRIAEERIVEHERTRVGPKYAHKVDHVSMRNSAAGYDILSCSIDHDSNIFPRFIEVKAVPPETFQFFWSKNEVATARTLHGCYFLYLLPVNKNGQFEIEKLMMISNPCSSILQDGSNWVIESDALVIQLNLDTSIH